MTAKGQNSETAAAGGASDIAAEDSAGAAGDLAAAAEPGATAQRRGATAQADPGRGAEATAARRDEVEAGRADAAPGDGADGRKAASAGAATAAPGAAEGAAAAERTATAEAPGEDPGGVGEAAAARRDEADSAERAEAPAERDAIAASEALEALRAERDAARDAALRAAAEAQNARRRAEQEIDRARKFALERFAGELLPMVDNLERALAAASGESDEARAVREGLELTRKGLLDSFLRFQIERVAPQPGEPFDPNLHEAMTMLPSPDMAPNSVLEVMQAGYTLGGRLLRPARVVVSKAPRGQPECGPDAAPEPREPGQ